MMKRLGILTLLLLLCAHPAQAQTACSVLSQSQLLNSFSDTAPAGSISPRNMRDFVCSSALLSSSGTLTSGDGAMFLNSGSGITLQDAANGVVAFPEGLNLQPANYTWSGNSESTVGGNLPNGNSGLWMWPAGNVTGTCTQPNSGAGSPDNCAFNRIRVKEGIQSTNGRQVDALNVELWETVAGWTGGSNAINMANFIQTPSGNRAAGLLANYGGAQIAISANTPDGGTSISDTNGAIFGIGAYATLGGNAAFWNGVVGEEIDIAMAANVNGTPSALDKIGMQIVATSIDNTDSQRPPNGNAVGLAFGQQNNGFSVTPGWDYAITVGGRAGFFPVKPTGTIFGIVCHVFNCVASPITVADGIDVSNATFTDCAFKSKNFCVVAGNVSATTFQSPGGNTTLPGIASTTTNGLYIGDTVNGASLIVSDPGGPAANTVNIAGTTTGGGRANYTCGGVSSDANVACYFGTKGPTSYFRFTVDNATAFQIQSGTGTLVNHIDVVPSATATAPQVLAGGSDTNVDLGLRPQGSGTLQFVTSGPFAANGSVATVLGSLGPAGSHTTVQKWLGIKDASGSLYYIPLF